MMELIRKSDALHAVLHNQGDAAVAAVQMIPFPWISVKDRMPDAYENVLAYNSESGDIDMAYYNEKEWVLMDLYEIVYLHPTHWMPLPDAPEVEG